MITNKNHNNNQNNNLLKLTDSRVIKHQSMFRYSRITNNKIIEIPRANSHNSNITMKDNTIKLLNLFP